VTRFTLHSARWILTTTQAAQAHQTATHVEHTTHREDDGTTCFDNFPKLYKVFFCFLVLVSSPVLVLLSHGWAFINGYMELRHCRPCWRYFEAFESGVRSRLRSDEMGYALVDFFLLLTFSRYAVNEDMRMRGYEIWDVGEDVYESIWIWN
jgi:hypothetical protein